MFSAYSAAFWRRLCPSPPVGPEDFFNLLSPPPFPHPYKCVSRTPILCVLAETPICPARSSQTQGGDNPSPGEEPLAHASSCLHPGREE